VPAWPVLRWKVLLWTAWFHSSVAVWKRSPLFWNSTLRRLVGTDVSGQPIGLETLLSNYQSMLGNIPEELRFLHWKFSTELCLPGIGESQFPQVLRRPFDSGVAPHIDPSDNR
jgi:hypothetical protein